MKNEITWNVADAVSDVNFDSSSSLTEGLWGVFKHKISNPLAHLLLVSDVWRISDHPSIKLWCDFVTANYPDRLMSLNPSDSIVQMPIGFRTCTQPFGRLLASFDMHLNRPLQWLLDSVSKNEDGNSQEIKEVRKTLDLVEYLKLICVFIGLFSRLVDVPYPSTFTPLLENTTISKNELHC